MIFPSHDKFLLCSKLYRIAQNSRMESNKVSRDTDSLLGELSDLEGDGISRSSVSPIPNHCMFAIVLRHQLVVASLQVLLLQSHHVRILSLMCDL